jgi:predicted RNA-binding protein with PUA-like domain
MATRTPPRAKPRRTSRSVEPAPRASSSGRWLVKSEPEVYPWSRLQSEGTVVWDGVRNYAARNHLRAMRVEDLVLFYHSNEGRQIVGVARVLREAFADPTAPGEDWSAVELGPVRPLARPVGLDQLRASPSLAGLMLLRQPRLSVMPLSLDEFAAIMRLGEDAPSSTGA